MPRRALWSLALSVTLACSLTACGGSSPPAEEPPPAAPPPAPVRSDVPPEALPPAATGEPGLIENPGSRWAIVTGFDWAFRMPAGWHRLSAEALSENRDQMLTGDSRQVVAAGGEGWQRTVQIAMSESPLDQVAGVVPTLIVTLREQDQPHPVAALCDAVRRGMEQAMTEVELMGSTSRQIAGRSGGVCVLRYTLSTRHGPQRVEAHSFFAMQDTLLLQVALSGPAPQDATELEALVSSVRAIGAPASSAGGAAPDSDAPADDDAPAQNGAAPEPQAAETSADSDAPAPE